MAYGTKYRFTFDSEQGTPFQILIKKDGYSGSVLDRAVGGSPVLRRDKSGSVCGTSLEIPAECAVDGEFEEFKTSVPFTFLVELYGGASLDTLIWTGYVTPELMSAPDIAPPYDVQVSCTDGLGELKYKEYPVRGGYTLADHLDYLLGFTNLGLSVEMVNDIYHDSYSTTQLLASTAVTLDFMAGRSCYEVLEGILAALHATITQHNGAWLIFRETGASITQRQGTGEYIPTSSGRAISVDNFGSMATHPDGWWPVGHMSHNNEPPRKRMVLTSENHYIENVLSDALWQAVSGGVDSGDYWSLAAAGDGMKQTQTFVSPVSKKLLLSIKVRNVGTGGDVGKLSVKVKAVGTSYAGSRTFYLANGTYARRNEQTGFSWSTSEVDSVIEVQAPAPEDTDEDYVNIGIVLPIYRNSARDYFYCSSLEITISNKEGTYEQRVYEVSLSKYERFSGFMKTVDLNNGARGVGSDVELIFATIAGGNLYNGVEQLLEGVLVDATSFDVINSWYSSKFSGGLDYLSLMARDYALSIAAARTRLRGVLNVPVGRARIPICFQDDHDSTYYFIDTFSWSLFNDELDVDMLSRPVASITVSDETLEEGESNNDTGHSQGAPSSGGGGGGGGGGGSTVSISNLLTTGTRIGTLTIDGVSKDIKASVVAVSNRNTNGFRIVTLTIDGIDHDIIAPEYSLVNIRNRLTEGVRIVTIQIGTSFYDIYAPSGGGGGGSDVSISGLISNGYLIGVLTIDSVGYNIKIPVPDVSIGGTDAAPTLVVSVGTNNSDSVALPVASATKAGIVSTSAQVFAGAKTFDRIYLGNSQARGAYIEWDDTNRAFKIVGDVYATGGITAGG